MGIGTVGWEAESRVAQPARRRRAAAVGSGFIRPAWGRSKARWIDYLPVVVFLVSSRRSRSGSGRSTRAAGPPLAGLKVR